MNFFVDTIEYKRECGTCSECCQGWLKGEIHDYNMSPHNPCHFVDENRCGGCCTIYEHRPEMCSSYKCVWLNNLVAFPNWMKPEKCKIIVTERSIENKETKSVVTYWQAKECGQKIDSVVLNWIITQCNYFGVNLEYEVAGQWYYIGNDEFMETMTGSKNKKLKES